MAVQFQGGRLVRDYMHQTDYNIMDAGTCQSKKMDPMDDIWRWMANGTFVAKVKLGFGPGATMVDENTLFQCHDYFPSPICFVKNHLLEMLLPFLP